MEELQFIWNFGEKQASFVTSNQLNFNVTKAFIETLVSTLDVLTDGDR